MAQYPLSRPRRVSSQRQRPDDDTNGSCVVLESACARGPLCEKPGGREGEELREPCAGDEGGAAGVEWANARETGFGCEKLPRMSFYCVGPGGFFLVGALIMIVE